MEMVKDGVCDTTEQCANSASGVIDKGAAFAHQATDRSAKFAHQAADRAASLAHQGVKKGVALVNSAAEKGSCIADAAAKKTSEAYNASEAFIQRNPHQSVASGFGVGVLLGAAAVFLMMSVRD